MRALVQRVLAARVEIKGRTVGAIGQGLLVFLGVGAGDTEAEVAYLVRKIAAMRIFSDEEGKMNLSCREVAGSVLVVSQFTLFADTKKGNRPSFIKAGPPDMSTSLYQRFIEEMKAAGIPTEQGEFGADMQVSLVNDGPVTIWLDTDHK